MTNPFADPALQGALRLSLAAMFAAAALHKARSTRSFTATLRNYAILPGVFAPAAAVTLVVVEIATAAALLAAPSGRAGAWSALALLALYSGAITVNLARGRRDLDCGCLGPGHRQPISAGLVARNGFAAAAAACLLIPVASRDLGWLDGLSIAAFVLALALVWVAGNRLLATRPSWMPT